MKKVIMITVALAAAWASAPAAHASGKVVIVGARAARHVAPWRGASGDSMRFQCLWFQRNVDYAGYVNGVEFDKVDAVGGRFNSVRVWLCHTRKTELESTFADNYTGFTPVQVLNMRSVAVGGTGWFDLGIAANRFNYNNRNNLLMEIRWDGDDGHDVRCWRSAQSYSRCFAYDHNATTGTVYNNGQRIRLTIGTMIGLEPTSLGRVKTLFR